MTGPYKSRTIIDGIEVEQIYHEPLFPFDKVNVKAIKIIAFDDEGKILGVKRGRTFDIPSGRLEWDDDDLTAATCREVYEQASVILGKVIISAVIENLPIQSVTPPTHTVVMTGFINKVEPMPFGRENKRAFLDKELFLKRYRFGDPEALKRLIDMASFYTELIRPRQCGKPPKKQIAEST